MREGYDYVGVGSGSWWDRARPVRWLPRASARIRRCRSCCSRPARATGTLCMPALPSGNPNLACMMIGEKAADLIRGRTLPPAGEAARPAA